MPHYRGHLELELPSSEFWRNHDQYKDDSDQNVILIVAQPLTNYNLVENFRFKVMNLVTKDQIKGGHKMRIEILDNNQKSIECQVHLKMYKHLYQY